MVDNLLLPFIKNDSIASFSDLSTNRNKRTSGGFQSVEFVRVLALHEGEQVFLHDLLMIEEKPWTTAFQWSKRS